MHKLVLVSMVTLVGDRVISSNIWIVNSLDAAVVAEPTWPNLIAALVARDDLTADQTEWAMNTIMGGNATDVQIAGFLVALRAKGETVAEVKGLVEAMLANARPLKVGSEALDIVGTGGDRLNTVNISTMAALVCAGAGATVVKHGNRASSSAAGSADVLEQLGVRLDMGAELVARAATEVGITFCFANYFHPSMRFAAVARREIGVPTAFNFLGPLTNPAHVVASAIGVADARMAPLVAGVLAARSVRALVFRGSDGLDELTTTGKSTVWEVRHNQVTETEFDPLDVGIPRATIADLKGKNAEFNAEVVRRILDGERSAVRDAVVLNAAAGLVAYDADATGPLNQRLSAAIARAEKSIDTGAAKKVLDQWVTLSTESA